MSCPSLTAILQLSRPDPLLSFMDQLELLARLAAQRERLDQLVKRLLDQRVRLAFEVLDRPDLLARRGLLARLES